MNSASLMNQRSLSLSLKETIQSLTPSEPEIPLISTMEDQATSHLHLSPILEEPSQKLLTTTESETNSPVNMSKGPNMQSSFSGPLPP